MWIFSKQRKGFPLTSASYKVTVISSLLDLDTLGRYLVAIISV